MERGCADRICTCVAMHPIGQRKRSHLLEPRIDWLAFQSEHTEYTLVDSAKRFLMHKTLKCFYAQRKLPKS